MTADNRKHMLNCPYWSEKSAKCTICANGLFIPLDSHADAFCKSSRFPACMQYELFSENRITLQEKVRKSEENRRKFLRIISSHAITLVKIFESGQMVPQIPLGAKTIDVSKSGMRVVTDKPLVHNALVQFFFDENFPLQIQKITGQVEWCNKQVDEPGYQVGVSFRGSNVTEALGRFCGQQHFQR